MAEALLALLAIVMIAELLGWIIVHLWWAILSIVGLYFLTRHVIVPWWVAEADARRHVRARSDIVAIHDETLRRMREAARRNVVDVKARDLR